MHVNHRAVISHRTQCGCCTQLHEVMWLLHTAAWGDAGRTHIPAAVQPSRSTMPVAVQHNPPHALSYQGAAAGGRPQAGSTAQAHHQCRHQAPICPAQVTVPIWPQAQHSWQRAPRQRSAPAPVCGRHSHPGTPRSRQELCQPTPGSAVQRSSQCSRHEHGVAQAGSAGAQRPAATHPAIFSRQHDRQPGCSPEALL